MALTHHALDALLGSSRSRHASPSWTSAPDWRQARARLGIRQKPDGPRPDPELGDPRYHQDRPPLGGRARGAFPIPPPGFPSWRRRGSPTWTRWRDGAPADSSATWLPASPPEAGRVTSGSSATSHCGTPWAAASSRRSASTSTSGPGTSPPGATSARWTPPATSAIGARAASRPSAASALVDRLRRIRVPGAEIIVEPVKEHRFVLVLRGAGLSGRLSETDPQALDRPPLPVRAQAPEARETAVLVNRFVTEARPLLADAAPANMVLLRGFDQRPALPRFPEVYAFRAAAIAAYPMYRGLARLVGMDVLKTGSTFADEIATLRAHWDAYDFLFLHYKDTDKAGEDGDFPGKVAGPRAAGRRAAGHRSAQPGRPRRQRGSREPRRSPRALLAPRSRRAGGPVRAPGRSGAIHGTGLQHGLPRHVARPRPHAPRPRPRPAPGQVRRLTGGPGRGV